MDASTWFMGFHMIQLGLVGLVAVSVFVLADQFHRASAWQTCLGMGIFLVYFSAYDTLAGIGTGLAMRERTRPPDVATGGPVRDRPRLAGVGAMGVLAQPSSARSGGYSPWATWRSSLEPRGAPRAEWLFIGLAAFFLLLGHPAPFGTIAFGSLFIAALIHERQSSRVPDRALPDTSRPALTE